MKLSLSRHFAVFASVICTQFTPYNFVSAATFEQQEVDQAQYIAIARPYGNHQYDLLILGQIPLQRQCWNESGTKPVTVDPLLLNFDFSGSCERSTDSNGYSVRIDGTDYGLNYLLRIVEGNGELLLVATNRVDRNQPDILIGRTYGKTDGFLKIFLNPGWRFTKRSYQGHALGHVYLTGDSKAMIPEEGSAQISSNLSNKEDTHEDTPTPTNNGDTSTKDSQVGSAATDEYTFTAESSEPPVSAPNNTSTTNSFSDNNFTEPSPTNQNQFSQVIRNNNENLESNIKSNSGELPPPPFSPSSLPPIAPPSQNPDSQMVPPPSFNSSNGKRQNLGDILNDFNGNPNPPASNSAIAQGKSYKVLAEAKTGSQQQQLRSLYPEAFPTKYNGQSFWQVGVFSTSDNAETVIQTLKNAGLNGKMIPF